MWPEVAIGGQHVGTGPSGVKIVHLPSGIEAYCITERSQHKNREIALSMIEAAVTHPYYRGTIRSEEHTSELQSLMRISYAVFCLKKKKIKMQQQIRLTRQNTN